MKYLGSRVDNFDGTCTYSGCTLAALPGKPCCARHLPILRMLVLSSWAMMGVLVVLLVALVAIIYVAAS